MNPEGLSKRRAKTRPTGAEPDRHRCASTDRERPQVAHVGRRRRLTGRYAKMSHERQPTKSNVPRETRAHSGAQPPRRLGSPVPPVRLRAPEDSPTPTTERLFSLTRLDDQSPSPSSLPEPSMRKRQSRSTDFRWPGFVAIPVHRYDAPLAIAFPRPAQTLTPCLHQRNVEQEERKNDQRPCQR